MADIVYDFEGADAATITEASEGFDLVEGTGSAVYDAPGLVAGSTTCALVVDRRQFVTDTVEHESVLFAFAFASPPSADCAINRFNSAVSGNEQAGLYVLDDGRLGIDAPGVGRVAESVLPYDGGDVYWAAHKRDADANFQECRLYTDTGVLIETLTGECGIDDLVEHRLGVLSSTVTFTCLFDDLTLSDQDLVPPVVEDIIGAYDMEGTHGANVTALLEGFDDLSGSGSIKYDAPGIVEDSLTCALIEGTKIIRTLSAARCVGGIYPDTLYAMWAVRFDVDVIDPMDIMRLLDSVGDVQSKIALRSGGKIRMSVGSDTIATAAVDIANGEAHWLLWTGTRSTAIQSVGIYSDKGQLIERLTGEFGTVATTELKLGNVSGAAVDFESRIDDITIAGTPLTPPGATGLVYPPIVGAVTASTALVAVEATGGAQARLVIAGVNTAAATLDVNGRGQVPVSLSEATVNGTTVPFDVEINPGTGDWEYAGSGSIPFLLPVGATGTSVTLAEGCHGSKNVDGIGTEAVWAEAMSGLFSGGDVPRSQVKLGDEGYPNLDDSNDVDDHIDSYIEVLGNHPSNADACSRLNTVRKFSDHDRAQGNTYFHGPAILDSIEAWETFWPHADVPGRAAEAPECSWQEWVDGRTIHIAPDDRSNYRSDPEDAESPSKSVLGEWQDERLFALLDALPDEDDTTDTTDIQGAVIYFDMIYNGTNAAGEFANKFDAIPQYATWKTTFESHAAGKRVVVISGDTHHLLMDDGTNNPIGLMTMSCAGMQRNTGNLKIFGEGVFTTWEFPQRDGSGDFTETKTRTYGLVRVIDTGSTYTIEITGREMYNDVHNTYSRTWAAYDPTGGILRRETYSIDGWDATDPTSCRRFGIRVGSVRRAIPGTVASRIPVPGRRGVHLNGNPRGAVAFLGWTQVIGNTDQSGQPSTEALYANQQEFVELFPGPVPHTVKVHPYPGAAATKEAVGWLLSDIDETQVEELFIEYPLLFELPDGVLRGPDVLTWSTSLASNQSGVPLAALTGSTADTDDGAWLVRGPFKKFTVTADESGDFFRWNPPGGSGEVLEGEYLLLDPVSYRAEINTDGSWEFDTGTDVSTHLESGGSAVLRLRPRAGIVPVTLEAIGKSSQTRVYFRGTPTYIR